MIPKTSSRAVAVVVGLWMAAFAAVLALATTGDHAAAQQGCGGGGSPSPSTSPSASSSGGGSTFPPPVTIPPSLVPVPGAGQKAAHERVQAGPKGHFVVKAPAVAAQEDTCRSTITIAYESGKNPKFTGKVGSQEPMCKKARKVAIRKIKKGKDPVVGRATTNTKGVYSVPARDPHGRFYAKVSKATVENRDGETVTCGAAQSKAIKP